MKKASWVLLTLFLLLCTLHCQAPTTHPINFEDLFCSDTRRCPNPTHTCRDGLCVALSTEHSRQETNNQSETPSEASNQEPPEGTNDQEPDASESNTSEPGTQETSSEPASEPVAEGCGDCQATETSTEPQEAQESPVDTEIAACDGGSCQEANTEPTNGACQKDADCGADTLCLAGKCTKQSCQQKSDCTPTGLTCQNNICQRCTQHDQCDEGDYCAPDGLCTKQECDPQASKICSNQKACKDYRCADCTDKSECGRDYSCIGGLCGIAVKDHKGALRWADHSYAKNCQEYYSPPPGKFASKTDGLYWIKPGKDEFQVYCLMSRAGGGWTLVLKADGSRSEFRYASSYWTNRTTYQPDKPDFDKDQAKLQSFDSVPFRRILLLFITPHDGTTERTAIVAKSANSLYDLLQDGKYKSFNTNLGYAPWRELVDKNQAIVQTGCKREGFNVTDGGSDTRVRIGIIADDDKNCPSPNSRIGIGGSGSSCGQDNSNTVGNTTGTCRTNKLSLKSFGYIFVR